ncbi:hypothetical protein BJ742DRAFT_831433, partial [Cladochytrium replicatum]
MSNPKMSLAAILGQPAAKAIDSTNAPEKIGLQQREANWDDASVAVAAEPSRSSLYGGNSDKLKIDGPNSRKLHIPARKSAVNRVSRASVDARSDVSTTSGATESGRIPEIRNVAHVGGVTARGRRGSIASTTQTTLPPTSSMLSPETQKVLKVMMRTAKLSYHQQNYLDQLVQDGNPLPFLDDGSRPRLGQLSTPVPIPRPNDLISYFPPKSDTADQVLTGYSRPSVRTLQQIWESGAFETDPYRPIPKKDSSKEKQRLQKWMEFNGQVPSDTMFIQESAEEGESSRGTKARRRRIAAENSESKTILDEYEMLIDEVDDRRQWLEDMEALGRADSYRRQIQQEMKLRLHRIGQIEKERGISKPAAKEQM